LFLPRPTIAAAQARVKGIDYDICVLPHILRWDTAQEVSIAPIGVFECIKLQIVVLELPRTPLPRRRVNSQKMFHQVANEQWPEGILTSLSAALILKDVARTGKPVARRGRKA
jgi:hypothetical protein